MGHKVWSRWISRKELQLFLNALELWVLMPNWPLDVKWRLWLYLNNLIDVFQENSLVLQALILSEAVIKAEFNRVVNLLLQDLKLELQVFEKLIVLIHQVDLIIFGILVIVEGNFFLVLPFTLIEHSQWLLVFFTGFIFTLHDDWYAQVLINTKELVTIFKRCYEATIRLVHGGAHRGLTILHLWGRLEEHWLILTATKLVVCHCRLNIDHWHLQRLQQDVGLLLYTENHLDGVSHESLVFSRLLIRFQMAALIAARVDLKLDLVG